MKKNKIKKIVSTLLVLVIGFSTVNVKAEATAVVDELPDTVIRNAIANEYKFNKSGIVPAESTNNVIEFLSKDGKYLLYCSDRNNVNFLDEVTLTKGSKMDYKIAYILKKGYNYNQQNLITGVSTDSTVQGLQEGQTESAQPSQGDRMANLWITQVALWNIQNTINKSDLNNEQLSYTVDSNGEFKLFGESSGLVAETLWQYVYILVNEANKQKDPAEATLNVTGDTNWTKSNNIAKSGLITIKSSSELATISTYSISLENAPEGTKVYKEDGTDITNNLENVPKETKIYITIDNSKMDKSKEYNFKLNAKANVTYDAAYQYVDNSNQCGGKTCQPSVLVGPETKEITGVINFKIIPDTASSISKSIYYVGFAILLCGAGLIYANIKPRKEESEVE